MVMKKENHQVYEKLLASDILKEEERVFGSLFEHPLWYIAEDVPSAAHLRKHVVSCTVPPITNTRERKKYLHGIIENFRRARRLKRIQKFECPSSRYGFTLPLIQGKNIYGYILLCNAEKEIPDASLNIFKLSVDNVIREIQKELELTKVCETIRPRAIALSTIHTIHRLISSTLDIDELLPRIARLSVQVMRANRCSIKLLDKKKRQLIPKTTVDIRRNKRIRLKKLPVGKGVPGRAVKKGEAIRGRYYLSVPLIDEEIVGVITVYDKISGKPFNEFDQEILSTLAEQAVIAIKNAQLYKEQQDVILGSIKSLAMILNTRSAHAHRSSKFIVRLTVEVGREMGMGGEELKSLKVANLLHDAGQVSVPDEILTKPTSLTGEEYALVKEHPARSVKIIEPLKALKPALPIILHHHEKYDGSGYPRGLKAENIPLGARIMAVTTAFEAMVALRPYRQTAKSVAEAVEEIKKNSGTQFDPKVVAAFVKVVNQPDIGKFLKKTLMSHG
jgi:HD-GYP domain-containing protein (c-di-GMP phosphodiesterase class II)